MVAPLVPDSALHASLLFAVGYGQTPDTQAPGLSSDMAESVGAMLDNQDTTHLIPLVKDTVRAGQQSLDQNPALTISAKRYAEIRSEFIATHGIQSSKGKQVWPVGATTILKRSGGSWNEALRAAGFATSTQQTPQGFGSARFTPDQFDAAIRAFRHDATTGNYSTKLQHYVEWRKELVNQGRTDIPSGPAIRNFYGSWSAALATASNSAPSRSDSQR
ncbi:hypothetical protein FEF26_04485 [Nesterenkonia salmonea]|uniref:Uncharacterized protein n=1 Tax=Nesterenkonia salmonea TaxID=1804987 RepID=A0A5R9BDH2_9MICC|nr:hypothetical protein [Nesterenkonia salmonea]TLP98654.1 hypothetical protein FEF26_04485 [Nesterenkonia salmonea]